MFVLETGQDRLGRALMQRTLEFWTFTEAGIQFIYYNAAMHNVWTPKANPYRHEEEPRNHRHQCYAQMHVYNQLLLPGPHALVTLHLHHRLVTSPSHHISTHTTSTRISLVSSTPTVRPNTLEHQSLSLHTLSDDPA
jgi:hypothetical protein